MNPPSRLLSRLLAVLLVSALQVACLDADQGLSLKTDWGSIESDGNVVQLKVDQTPDGGRLNLPRLNNRMKEVRVAGMPDMKPQLKPEIDHWVISLPKGAKAPLVVELETIEPVRYCEEAYVVKQTDAKQLLLPAHHAETHSQMLRFEPQPHKNTIGYWVKPADWAEWQMEVTAGGRYAIEVLQGCGKNQGGSEVDIVVVNAAGKKQVVPFVIEDTGHFQNFKPRVIGKLELEPGKYALQVRPTKLANKAIGDIRQIKLLAQ